MTLSMGGELPPRARSPSEKLQPTRPPNSRPLRSKVRRRRLHPVLRFISGVLTVALLLMAGTGVLALVVKTRFEASGPLQQAAVVTVPRGRGLNAIANNLERDGIVSDSRLFVANVYSKGAQSRLKAGKYKIPGGASISDVVDRLVRGKAISYKVTLVEGQTSQQIVARINAAPHLVGEIVQVPPEGSLLPDTYLYSSGMKRSDLLDLMRVQQQAAIDRLWQTRQQGLPLASKQEALILASIVEKETGKAAERALVAAVFINRLRKGIRLQSDPTIIYGLVGGKGRLGHPIRRSELNKVTKYNTYQINRLPPTPICNPGEAAIAAVLNPAVSDKLFFVADGTGGHVFAKTLKEHNANVVKWRRIEKLLRAKRKKRAALKAQQKTALRASIPVPAASSGSAIAAVLPVSARKVSKPRGKAKAGLKVLNRGAAAGALGIPLPVRKPKKHRR